MQNSILKAVVLALSFGSSLIACSGDGPSDESTVLNGGSDDVDAGKDQGTGGGSGRAGAGQAGSTSSGGSSTAGTNGSVASAATAGSASSSGTAGSGGWTDSGDGDSDAAGRGPDGSAAEGGAAGADSAGTAAADAAGPAGSVGTAGTAGSGGSPVCVANATGCVDRSHAGHCNASGTGWAVEYSCSPGFDCENGACVGPIRAHLQRSVDLQYVQDRSPDELDQCAADVAQDIAAGRLACDAKHAVQQLKPRFGLFLGNTWIVRNAYSPDSCQSTIDGFVQCQWTRLKRIVDVLHVSAPEMLCAAHMAEFVAQTNVTESVWKNICVSGTQGKWGPNTCVPDIAHKQAARDYLVDWGKRFVDAGIRAFVFGQARLMGGGAGCTVSSDGAAGFKWVIDMIRSYAEGKGISKLYFGAQAACSVQVGGVEQIDFVMGAQHLEPHNGWLLQPLLRKGPYLHGGIYGSEDWHDANLQNDSNDLPVLLDYDNWSEDPAVPDDIRHLARISDNAQRARVLADHFRHLHLYNPNAYLSIPVSKVLGNNSQTTCTGVNQWHFSANACGIVSAAQQLFLHPDIPITSSNTDPEPAIRRGYWGQQLRGKDAMVSWLYWVLLRRAMRPGETNARVQFMPSLINTPLGARFDLADEITGSTEFAVFGVSNDGFVDLVYRAILLREPDAVGKAFWLSQLASKTRSEVLYAISNCSEANDLYAE
jgi:hypothetical protein